MDEITRIAHRLQEADGVVAVALGGSGARGTHRPDSDVDLGLYYRPRSTRKPCAAWPPSCPGTRWR